MEELLGQCADYPEYGRVRNFRLHRTRIQLSLAELSIRREPEGAERPLPRRKLDSFRFTVSVEPDEAATSAIAEPVDVEEPPYLHPGEPGDFSCDCLQVVRRKTQE